LSPYHPFEALFALFIPFKPFHPSNPFPFFPSFLFPVGVFSFPYFSIAPFFLSPVCPLLGTAA